MAHTLKVMQQFIHPIRMGLKTIEGRIHAGNPATFKVGDTIRFFCPPNEADDIHCTIVKIEPFASFKEMLEKTNFKHCIPSAHTLEEALAVYDSIPSYKERAKEHGVLAIHIKTQKMESLTCTQ